MQHSSFRADVVEWLLEPVDPSVRFWALRHLKDKPPTHPDVQEAQEALMQSPCVKAILSAQRPEGHWCSPSDMYLPKYTASTHSLLILAELGAKKTPAIERGLEHIFSFQRDSGHFLPNLPKSKRGRASTVTDACCIDGNILYYMTHFGYLDDPRVQQLIDFLVEHHSEKGGWPCRAYPINPSQVFPTNCYMGAVKVLRGLAAIPENRRSRPVREIIKQEVEIILQNAVYKYKRASDGSRKEKAGWKRFGFPLFYQSDALEVLDVLTSLHIRDERMEEAARLVVGNRGPDGRWRLQHSFNGKMWCDIDVKGQPSKWITLRALRVLRRFYVR